jgi:hypothetical protein
MDTKNTAFGLSMARAVERYMDAERRDLYRRVYLETVNGVLSVVEQLFGRCPRCFESLDIATKVRGFEARAAAEMGGLPSDAIGVFCDKSAHEKGVAEGRRLEREAVVGWLRAGWKDPDRAGLIAEIERGEHVK